MREIPVYLFLGFLESGKTKFIQETLEDKRFNNGEKTVILLCEEGEEEYDLSTFNSSNVFIEKIDSEDELTSERLAKIEKELKPDRIMCEYNGMFRIQTLTDALPASWIVAQVFTFVDSSTFEIYNTNMRQLVFEKIAMSDLIAFCSFLRRSRCPILSRSIASTKSMICSRSTRSCAPYQDAPTSSTNLRTAR